MAKNEDAIREDAKCVHSVEVTVTIKREEGYNSPEVIKSTHKVGTLDLATAKAQARVVARECVARVETSAAQVEKAHNPEKVEEPDPLAL